MLVVPLLTSLTQGWAMGWASAPYDPYWAERHPRRAALMAAAGPAGNLLVASVALTLIKIGLTTGYFVAPDSVNLETLVARATTGDAGFAGTALSVLLVLNVFLAAFNLLPLPPLDGGAVVGIFLPESMAAQIRQLQSNGMLSMVGLLIAWRVFPLMTEPLFALVLKLVHPGFSYS
jgi:Zn-dependent protease